MKIDLEVGIVGASIAGLTAAHALARQGARVHLFERSLHLAERGGSGIMLDAEVACSIAGLATRTHGLRRVLGSRMQTLWTRPLRKMATSWGELYRCLRSRVEDAWIHNGCTVTACECDGSLHFEDGSHRRFDLVVGADGLGSTVRACLAPHFQPEYCGYVAIRGMCESSDWPAHGEVVNLYGRHCHAVLYAPAGPMLNWMCYCNATEAGDLLTDAQGMRHRWSLPPDAVSPDLRKRLLELVDSHMPEAFSRLVRATSGIYLQAIYQGLPDTFVSGRVALIGDAAHVSPPHLGAATSIAYQDVESLCQALGRGDSLQSWGEKRREVVRGEIEVAHRLGQEIQAREHNWDDWDEPRFEAWWQEITGGRQLYFDTPRGSH
ncbi:hypothetical protein ABS71_04100 [bacterium SCN 62-11]|nr:FAD-dependent monooxygenase [Candidatus Eremiobacteraeota bacterium]ODT75782.1 MAG: hypothetical protein ABS71_04100 [bacterium SCN 62-11]